MKEIKDAIGFLQEANLTSDQRYCVDVLIKAFDETRLKCHENMKTGLSLKRQLMEIVKKQLETEKNSTIPETYADPRDPLI